MGRMATLATKKNPKLGYGLGVGRSFSTVRLLGLGGQGCRGMGWLPSLGLTFYFYLVICIGDVTGVTEKWIATSLLLGAILHHKDDSWSFDHFDTITVSMPDAPRPDEIVVVLAVADGGRPHPRCGNGPR